MKTRLSTKASVKSLSFEQLKYLCAEFEYAGRSDRASYLKHLATQACIGEDQTDVDAFVAKVATFDKSPDKEKNVDPLTQQVFGELDPYEKK